MRDYDVNHAFRIYGTAGMTRGATKICKRQMRKRSRAIVRDICDQQIADALAVKAELAEEKRLKKAEAQAKRYIALRQELRQIQAEMEPEALMCLFLTGSDCTCGWC